MKIKYILKKANLTVVLTAITIAMASCDGDSDSSNTLESPNVTNSDNTSEFAFGRHEVSINLSEFGKGTAGVNLILEGNNGKKNNGVGVFLSNNTTISGFPLQALFAGDTGYSFAPFLFAPEYIPDTSELFFFKGGDVFTISSNLGLNTSFVNDPDFGSGGVWYMYLDASGDKVIDTLIRFQGNFGVGSVRSNINITRVDVALSRDVDGILGYGLNVFSLTNNPSIFLFSK